MTRWIVPGRPGPEALGRLLTTAHEGRLSYDHVGSTMTAPVAGPAAGPVDDSTAPTPMTGTSPGRVHRRSRDVGSGQQALDRAVVALRSWACHAGIGATVFPAAARLVEGETLLVILPAGLVSIVVPNRIVAVVDTPTTFGFAYGTIDGHQERGEESFVATLGHDGRVTAEITVDAEPATVLASLGAPIVGWFQHRAVDRYLAAWSRASSA